MSMTMVNNNSEVEKMIVENVYNLVPHSKCTIVDAAFKDSNAERCLIVSSFYKGSLYKHEFILDFDEIWLYESAISFGIDFAHFVKRRVDEFENEHENKYFT